MKASLLDVRERTGGGSRFLKISRREFLDAATRTRHRALLRPLVRSACDPLLLPKIARKCGTRAIDRVT